MKKKSIVITEIDRSFNVAFTDQGHILEVDSYVDEEDNPCLPEEAFAAYVRCSPVSFQKYEFPQEED